MQVNELWVMMSNEGYPSFVGQYDLTIDIAYARVFRDELFFDLDNVAYSHRKCNSGARRCAMNVRADSGYKGVVACKDANRKAKYKAVINAKDVKVHIGYFATAEEAAAEYDKVAVQKLGERAVTNKMLGLI